jgi:hypothetical protein
MTTSSRRRLHRGVAVGLFPPPVTAATANAATSNDADDGLAVIPWAEIMTHRYLADLWVVIDGKVYDMTEFIASGEHPGGEEIPLKYGGRDATEYWHELHGHIESEIAADGSITQQLAPDFGAICFALHDINLVQVVDARFTAGHRVLSVFTCAQKSCEGWAPGTGTTGAGVEGRGRRPATLLESKLARSEWPCTEQPRTRWRGSDCAGRLG